MKTSLLGLGAALLLLLDGVATGELYRVTVSREAQDLYRVEYTSREVYIKTRYCYAYVYYEEAIVDDDRMVIHFLDAEEDCDIERFLHE